MVMVYRIDKGASLTYAELDNNIFELDARVAKADKLRGGWQSAFDTATTGSPISVTGGSTWYYLTSNGSGTKSSAAFLPEGVNSVWNTSTNRIDLTDLTIGDMVHVTAIAEVTTSAANQTVKLRVITDPGGGDEFLLPMESFHFKTAAAHLISARVSFPVGDASTRDDPSGIQINSDSNATVIVKAIFIEVVCRGEV
jgi:hypothetical protein